MRKYNSLVRALAAIGGLAWTSSALASPCSHNTKPSLRLSACETNWDCEPSFVCDVDYVVLCDPRDSTTKGCARRIRTCAKQNDVPQAKQQ